MKASKLIEKCFEYKALFHTSVRFDARQAYPDVRTEPGWVRPKEVVPRVEARKGFHDLNLAERLIEDGT